MHPSDVLTVLTKLLPTRRPVYLWGPPGCAKSSLVRDVARDCLEPIREVAA